MPQNFRAVQAAGSANLSLATTPPHSSPARTEPNRTQIPCSFFALPLMEISNQIDSVWLHFLQLYWISRTSSPSPDPVPVPVTDPVPYPVPLFPNALCMFAQWRRLKSNVNFIKFKIHCHEIVIKSLPNPTSTLQHESEMRKRERERNECGKL